MLPIWIINLTEDEADRIRLKELIASVSGQHGSSWYYTEIGKGVLVDNFDNCRTIFTKIVEEGRACFSAFQKQGYKVNNIQVCIIGNAGEIITQTSFQVLPLLLRQFMPSILGKYTHHKIEITGLLFASCKMKQWNEDERLKCALFFEELNTLTSDLQNDFYSRIVISQEVQRSDMQFYQELDKSQIQEFLFETLLHLFYVGRKHRKLMDVMPASNYYSIGAASVYYDSREHKDKDLQGLFVSLIDKLKDPDNVSETDAEAMVEEKFPKGSIAIENIQVELRGDCDNCNVDIKKIEVESGMYPLSKFMKGEVYTSYYLDYLRFMPARILEFTKAYSHLLYSKITGQIQKNKQLLINKYTDKLYRYGEIFRERDCDHLSIAQMKMVVNILKNRLIEEKEKIEGHNTARYSIFDTPDYLTSVDDENDKYSENELVDRVKDTLQNEPTVLGLFSRCLLLGILLVLIFIPLFGYISPSVIDLGDISRYKVVWMIILFLIPFSLSISKFHERFLFIRGQKRVLQAHVLDKVKLKINERVESVTIEFYEELIAACDSEIARYNEIENLLVAEKSMSSHFKLPVTIFNQSLIHGRFMDQKLLKNEGLMDMEIVHQGLTKKVSAMNEDDSLTLLKDIFNSHDNNLLSLRAAKDVSLKDQVTKSLSHIQQLLNNNISASKARNIASLLAEVSDKDNSAVTLKPLLQMAGINGTITSQTDEWGLVIRSSEEINPALIPQEHISLTGLSKETEPFLFVTSWSAPKSNLLNVRNMCDIEFRLSGSQIPFSVMVTCLFAKYRRKSFTFRIGNLDIPLSIGELERLDMNINNMRI